MTSDVKVDLYGKYTWELLIDIDNSTNEGKIRRTERYKKTTRFSYKTFAKEVSRRTSETSQKVSAGIKYDIISMSTEVGSRTEEFAEFEKSAESHSDTAYEEELTTEVEVGPHSRSKLYQLVFYGPGMVRKTGTLVSEPHAMADVIFNCIARPVLLLSNINIVYTDDPASKPSNSITEVNGANPDINVGFKGKYVWLVPSWTANPAGAASSLEVIIQGNENSAFQDMAKGAGGDFRYLRVIRDVTSPTRIGSVKLWRSSDPNSRPEKAEWNGCTIDINQGRKGDYLYVCWKNVPL